MIASAVHAAPVSFHNEVMAVLSRAGCNMGACHGNLNGKGGLKLSLRGENSEVDFHTLTRDALARRVDVASPAESLLLMKATGQVPHEGGVRFSPASMEYRLLKDWITAGANYDGTTAAKAVKLTVTPTTQILFAPRTETQITATVTFADGSTKPITDLVAWESNNIGVAKVAISGLVSREADGETVVLVRYLNLMQPVRIAFIPDRAKPDFSQWNTTNPIDKLTAAKWAELRLKPSDVASDAVYLRRVYLDLCGTIPTAQVAREFLADANPAKRAKLVDILLGSPEFAQFWAQKWADLLRNEEKSLDRKGVQVFYRWIKGWIADDKPMNEFAREVLAARGSTYETPAANFYRAVREPYQRAESVAQVFLGLRISCAKCHNHPFDVWTQDDYHRFAATFARIGYRVPSNARRDDLDKHEFVGEQFVTALGSGELSHPRGGSAKPKFLGTTDDGPEGDRLTAFADWVASDANPFFAKSQANRVWLHLMGRGLVDPNDDFRTSNPPTNPELLQHLTTSFMKSGYRLKPLIREIVTSQTYQLASTPNETNASDDLHFSHALVQPLEAEQLLDAISGALGTSVKFPGYPLGLRAGEVPATPQTAPRRGNDGMGMRFLKVFGKPDRLLTCECERSEDPGMFQSFQMITGRLVDEILRNPQNRLGREELTLDELYLATLTRLPSEVERKELTAYIAKFDDRRTAWEDIAWGLVNSKEFLLRR
jgi:Protein of unknown function (DUF1549)/Protein of unknown function (DUF1553)